MTRSSKVRLIGRLVLAALVVACCADSASLHGLTPLPLPGLTPDPGPMWTLGNVPSQVQATHSKKSASSHRTARSHEAAHHRHRHHAKQNKLIAAVALTAPVPMTMPKPEAPPVPEWPISGIAEEASVVWNGRDLSITADNSSLSQILRDVSVATGVKVENAGNPGGSSGLFGSANAISGANDQRIFGNYGPAGAREVLGELLDGSGYNIVIIGDQGEGTPREVVLSAKSGHSTAGLVPKGQSNQSGDDDSADDQDAQEPQAEPPSMHRPFGGLPPQNGQSRTPQQILDELQRRQQQMQQQQGNQQPQGNQQVTPQITPLMGAQPQN